MEMSRNNGVKVARVSSLKSTNNAGQSLIEMIIFMNLIVAAVAFIITGLSWSYFYFSIHFFIDEALICQATLNSKNCVNNFEKKLSAFTPFIKIESITFTNHKGTLEGRVHVELPFHFNWKVKRKLK